MKTQSVLKAIKKAGFEVTEGHNGILIARGEVNMISFYNQDGRATCLHVQGINEQSDIMTDYFPGFFPRTIKGAMFYLTETKKVKAA